MIKVLQFFRFIDENGDLSLTNIAVIAALINVALQFDVDVYDVVALGITLASYQFKRVVAGKQKPPEDKIAELAEKLRSLESKFAAVMMSKKLPL